MATVAGKLRVYWRPGLVVLLVSVALPASAGAAAAEHHFTLRAYGLGLSFSHTQESGEVDTFSDRLLRGRFGAGVDAEVEVRDWVGLDLGLSQVKVDQRNRSFDNSPAGFHLTHEENGQIDLRSLALGLSFHPIPGHRSALYVMPFVSGEQFHGGLNQLKSHFGYGVVLGTDIPLGTAGWALTASARAVGTSIDSADRNSASPDNVVGYLLGIGFAYRH